MRDPLIPVEVGFVDGSWIFKKEFPTILEFDENLTAIDKDRGRGVRNRNGTNYEVLVFAGTELGHSLLAFKTVISN